MVTQLTGLLSMEMVFWNTRMAKYTKENLRKTKEKEEERWSGSKETNTMENGLMIWGTAMAKWRAHRKAGHIMANGTKIRWQDLERCVVQIISIIMGSSKTIHTTGKELWSMEAKPHTKDFLKKDIGKAKEK